MTLANDVKTSAVMTSQKRIGWPMGDVRQRLMDLDERAHSANLSARGGSTPAGEQQDETDLTKATLSLFHILSYGASSPATAPRAVRNGNHLQVSTFA